MLKRVPRNLPQSAKLSEKTRISSIVLRLREIWMTRTGGRNIRSVPRRLPDNTTPKRTLRLVGCFL